jgi:subtilisin family serine protease
MRSRSSLLGTAFRESLARRLAFPLLALLAAGCSAQRLPLAPDPSDPEALAAPGAAALDDGSQDRVVITLAEGVDASAFAADYDAALVDEGWTVAVLSPGEGTTSDQLLSRVASDTRVRTAERESWVETAETRQRAWAFDDGYGSPTTCAYQTSTWTIGLHEAHTFSRGAGVRIAILDTGADLAHPMLAGRVTGGWDFVDGDADPSDVGDGLDNDGDGWVDEARGHGTHVAGIAVVVAPEAELLVARVLDTEGRGDMATVARAVRWAVAQGARVINLSLGGLTRSDAVQLALEEATAWGAVSVAAAGNWGSLEPEEFPGSSRYAIAVAALDPYDVLASFSSHGTYIGISAPGVDIRSAFADGQYALWSGTSMATPFVSGGAALLLAANPEWTRRQVLERLEVSARDISAVNPLHVDYIGAGALDLGAALAPMVEDPEGTLTY